MSMLTTLDVETRNLHASVDSYWLDLMASGVTREQYRSQLVRAYGFEAPLESALITTPNLVIADRLDRTRSGLLAQDLLALGVTPGRLTALPQARITSFDDPIEALGWKYVAERPSQLHSAIKRNVVQRVPTTANALAYLSASDGIAAARWQSLGMFLDEIALRPLAADRLISAAKAAFTVMGTWFRESSELSFL